MSRKKITEVSGKRFVAAASRQYMRAFYLAYPELPGEIQHAVRVESERSVLGSGLVRGVAQIQNVLNLEWP